MRLRSAISDEQRRAIIVPEAEALMKGDYYDKLLANARKAKLDATNQFLIPVAGFLVRAARRVLSEQEQQAPAPVQIKDRAAAGLREVKHISRVCMKDGLFEQYRRDKDFAKLTIQPNRAPTRLSTFGEAIFRDIGWVAGGVTHALQDQGYTTSPAEVLKRSPKLQRVGWIPEAAIEGLRLHLGMPYIKPELIQLHDVPGTSNEPLADFAPNALKYIPLARNQMGCPARRVLDPSGQGTAFAAEWDDMVTYLVPPYAKADGPISAIMD